MTLQERCSDGGDGAVMVHCSDNAVLQRALTGMVALAIVITVSGVPSHVGPRLCRPPCTRPRSAATRRSRVRVASRTPYLYSCVDTLCGRYSCVHTV